MTVTSVGLTMPSDTFSVAGSPVTSSGTLAVTEVTQAANTFWRGPASGSPATPTWGAIQNADLPTPTNLKTLGSIRFADQFSGSDIGDKINAAYFDLPSTGGTIIVPSGSYSFSTPIYFGTANKPVVLDGLAGAVLTYTLSTGTAVVINNGSGSSGVGCPGSEIRNIVFYGSSPTNSAYILYLGGTNGAMGFKMSGGAIHNCGNGVVYGDNTWRTHFENVLIDTCTQLLWYESGTLTNSGEQLSFVATIFANANSFDDAVEIGDAGLQASFVNCSFDNAQFVLTGGLAFLVNCHFENPGVCQTDPFIASAGVLSLVNCQIAQDQTVDSQTTLVSLDGSSGANTYIAGLTATSNASITNLITLAGAGNLTFIGPGILNGFSNILNYTGSGAYLIDFGGGSIKTNQAFQINNLFVGAATPTAGAGQVAFGNSSGFGNGAAGVAMTTTSRGSGSGPSTPQTIMEYLGINIGGTNYWIPLVQ